MRSPYDLEITETCSGCKFCMERLFRGLPPEASQAFDRIKSVGLYPKGALLFVEGQVPRGIYVLCGGRAKLTTSSHAGKTLIVRLAEEGEVLGLSATLSGEPYHLSAEAIAPCQADFVRRDDFLRFLREYPEVCLRVVEMLGHNLQSAYGQMRAFGRIRSAMGNLAGVLLRWCEEIGEETPEGIKLKVPLMHKEIAQMIGTSRETVSRLMNDFKRQRLIALRGSELIVRDKAALAEKARSG